MNRSVQIMIHKYNIYYCQDYEKLEADDFCDL